MFMRIEQGELRKIQLTGGSTYIVSLPKDWIEHVGLEKGDIIRFSQKDEYTLLLQPQDIETFTDIQKITINIQIDDKSEEIIRRITSAYILGYSTIKLEIANNRIPGDRKIAVKNFARRKLIGTEIISDLPNELKLQILISFSELSIVDALKRLNLIVISMHQDSFSALENKDTNLYTVLSSKNDDVERFSLYLLRLLNISVSENFVIKDIDINSKQECLDYLLVIKSIESIANHAVRISQNVQKLNLQKINNKLIIYLKELRETALEIYQNSMNALLSKNHLLATEVLEKEQYIKRKKVEAIDEIMRNAMSEASILRLIVDSIFRTMEYGMDIAEVVLNLYENKL